MHNPCLDSKRAYGFLFVLLRFSYCHVADIPRLDSWFQKMAEGHMEQNCPTKLSQPSQVPSRVLNWPAVAWTVIINNCSFKYLNLGRFAALQRPSDSIVHTVGVLHCCSRFTEDNRDPRWLNGLSNITHKSALQWASNTSLDFKPPCSFILRSPPRNWMILNAYCTSERTSMIVIQPFCHLSHLAPGWTRTMWSMLLDQNPYTLLTRCRVPCSL